MRVAAAAALLVLGLAGCGGGGRPARLDFHGLGAIPVVRAGGQDAIPAIDRPRFDPPSAARGVLRRDDLVVGAIVDGRAHAYPIDLLSLHEVVNDGPLVVAWCPLCRTAIGFDRHAGGRRLTFGVSGLLLHANLVLYDRESGSLWSQLGGRALSGRYRGTRLRLLPLAQVTWAQWLRAHPDTLVLSIRRDRFATRFTHESSYADARGAELSSDPYLAYGQKVNVYYRSVVRGLAGSTPVLGVRIGGVAKAYPLDLLRRRLSDTFAGHRLLIVPDADALSAAVFEHGTRLPATTAYWFAWRAFYPQTLIYSPRSAGPAERPGSSSMTSSIGRARGVRRRPAAGAPR